MNIGRVDISASGTQTLWPKQRNTHSNPFSIFFIQAFADNGEYVVLVVNHCGPKKNTETCT